MRDEDEEREIKQTKQIANKVRPAQRPAWPCRQAWLCVVPAQGVFIRREQEERMGGRGGAGSCYYGRRLGSARTMNLSLSTSPPTKLVSVQVKCQSKGDDEGTDGKGEQEKRGEGGGSTSVTRRKRMMDEFVICRLNKYVPGTPN